MTAPTIAQLALSRLPPGLTARVTFTRELALTDATGAIIGTQSSAITGTAAGAPGDLDEYRALGLVQSRARTLVFVPDTAGDLPQEGDTVEWAGATWAVKTATPVEPGSVTLAARVVIVR
jgi:hypothetical protein